MDIWTIYDHPSDYACGFVARRFEVTEAGHGPTDECVYAPTLEQLRAMLPADLYRIERSPEDDPVIVEVWL